MDVITLKEFKTEFDALTKVYEQELSDIFDDYIVESSMPFNFNKKVISSIALDKIYYDLLAFVEEDPAARGKGKIATQSTGFKAVRFYRYVQSIIEVIGGIEKYPYIISQVRHISEDIKVATGVDIHPLAKIGNSFIIDHGMNTVIGERCDIGNNFHIMQDVVLGANSNIPCDPKDRHPKIGNNVTIFGGAKILGNISIGDECIIGANCVVLNDIPPRTNVSIVNQLQITKIKTNTNPKIFGIIPKDNNELLIVGDNMDGLYVEIIKYDCKASSLCLTMEKHDIVSCDIIDQDSKQIRVKIINRNKKKTNFSLRLFSSEKNIDIIIKECLAYNYIN